MREIANIAHNSGALLTVDNCFCTPAFQIPLSMGADVVVHSATKHLHDQGRVPGGALVGSEDLMAAARGFVRLCGPSMSPFNVWISSKGLATLQLHMDAHNQRAQAFVERLE